ncbi:MAG: cytochrome c biogenesis protein CcsA [candidate division Zixibacteria bacterium]|nr:cytochrome c biogenesis protein CcsA [candidate division Zixibacteria bacterium]
MWWKIAILLVMSAVIVLAFVTASPMNPTITLGPVDVYRIFYFHVPTAWVASVAFLVAMFQAIQYLRTRDMSRDVRAAAANRLGLVFAILAVITGSIFARMTWGEFWNWSEIREVSIFILLLIYGAYFALRSALPDPETRATLSAVLTIIFAAAALFLIFVLPRVYPAFSQHPSDTIVDSEGQITMGSMVIVIFATSLVVFTALFFWIYRLTVRIGLVEQKRSLE